MFLGGLILVLLSANECNDSITIVASIFRFADNGSRSRAEAVSGALFLEIDRR